MNVPGTFASPSRWSEKIVQELAPAHGRYQGALRTAAATVLAAFILLALQAPMIAPGLYLIFLVSYDLPYLTLRSSIVQLASQSVGISAALLMVAATGNDPLARVLGIALFTFISAFLLSASRYGAAAMNLGIFAILTLSQWESHRPAEKLVHLSLWPIATGAVAVGCKIAIEYLCTRRDPRHALQREMEARIEALEEMFCCYASGAPEEELQPRIVVVARYAVSGQEKMHALLKELRSHPPDEILNLNFSTAWIPAIARLLDLAAAFARGNPSFGLGDPAQQTQFRCLALAFSGMRCGRLSEVESIFASTPEPNAGPLAQMWHIVSNLGAMTYIDHRELHERQLTQLTNKPKHPWFYPDAWSNVHHLIYASKLSFCATLCYVLYNALAWPGISTATLTVLIAGLSSTGATNQRMIFRIIGSIIGGGLLGLGCVVCVYPYADTAMPFFLSIALVSFFSAWVARSAHFSYVGMQIAFSFYLVAFEQFSAPTQMTPARDRVLGILLALVIMWMFFHQLHPERTVDKMRDGLARLLGLEADIVSLVRSGTMDQIWHVRQQLNEIVVGVRTMAEAIPYELDQHVERDVQLSEQIQNAMVTAETLLLTFMSEGAHSVEASPRSDPLGTAPRHLEQGLRELSRILGRSDDVTARPASPNACSPSESRISSPQVISNLAVIFADIQQQCRAIQ